MRASRRRAGHPGFVSYILVLSTGVLLTLIMVFAYRRALLTQSVQADVQLRVDYSEKEDTILRSIVAIMPNRTIRAMQSGSNLAGANRDSLRWQNIFSDALAQANARTSIDPRVRNAMGAATSIAGNTGDAALGTISQMFTNVHGGAGSYYVTPGLNRDLGASYPASLSKAGGAALVDDDYFYPIVAKNRIYGALAATRPEVKLPVDPYKDFNLLTYPEINFGYAKPGDSFVAKRNWWAFSMDLADHDDSLTSSALFRRRFVLSLYEVPSQLAISSSAFMALGKYGGTSGGSWENVTISGNIFAGKAKVEGGANLPTLASRRGVEIASGSSVGGLSGSPFTPGVREQYEVTTGQFFPVSVPSESGRAAFIPINRGIEFFDYFANATESNTISPTSWNNYSSGAVQCAMRVEVAAVTSASNPTPTSFRFHYINTSGNRVYINDPASLASITGLPSDYSFKTTYLENQTLPANAAPVDVIMRTLTGVNYFKAGVQPGTKLQGSLVGLSDSLVPIRTVYTRPTRPFEAIVSGPQGRRCVAVYPERVKAFLTHLANAAGLEVNHSLAVNSNYGNVNVPRPSIPSTSADYGLMLSECANLSAFPKGFSLVTNFCLFIGGDFNTSPYTAGGSDYPPCSLFAPEKRYGVEASPYSVTLTGQVGSLASDSGTEVRPLDSFGMNNEALVPGRNTVNLRPITHPKDLPPITMMNWLILLEERRGEFN